MAGSISTCGTSHGGVSIARAPGVEISKMSRSGSFIARAGVFPSRFGDAQLLANLAAKMVRDFAVTRHGRGPQVRRIVVDGVATALAQELTPVRGQVTQQVD